MPSKCAQCDKEFVDRRAYLNHKKAKHGGGEQQQQQQQQYQYQEQSFKDTLAAPVSGSGYWVDRHKFHGRKSFGAFKCNCRSTWVSAHSYPQYRQDCKKCRKSCLPTCLWVNVDNSDDSDVGEYDEKTKPHHRDKCEACRRGVCDAF